MWQVLEFPPLGIFYWLLLLWIQIFFAVVNIDDYNYLCWFWYHCHFSNGSDHTSLHWYSCFAFFNFLSPKVACPLPLNIKAWWFLSLFLSLMSIFLSNWGTGHLLWWPWIHSYFNNDYQCLWLFQLLQGFTIIYLLLFRFIDHIYGQDK